MNSEEQDPKQVEKPYSAVDKSAQKRRHKKIFRNKPAYAVLKKTKLLYRKIRGLFKNPFKKKSSSKHEHPISDRNAPKIIFKKGLYLAMILFVFNSINFEIVFGSNYYGYEYINFDLAEFEEGFIADSDGYLVKSIPLGAESIYKRNRVADTIHVISPGETMSLIAYRYGLSVNTVVWANSSVNPDRLKSGQEITIPREDGIYALVEKNDTLEKIANRYKGDVDDIIAFNNIDPGVGAAAGEKIFIPDGRRPYTVIATAKTSDDVPASVYKTNPNPNPRPAYVNNYSSGPSGTSVAGNGNIGFIRPTTGILTQGYHGYHRAYDIASNASPPIYAAMSGKVVTAKTGTYGGGYGNYIIIQHDNGYKTLYAHFARVDVSQGQWVEQGQQVGIMGTTGRSSGIHLHLEVINPSGVKVAPSAVGIYY